MTSASRHVANATSGFPRSSTSTSTAAGLRGRSATSSARRGSSSRGDTAWWVERAFGNAGQLEDGVFVTGYSSLPQLASWILRQDGRAIPVEPDELRREVPTHCAPSANDTRKPRRSSPRQRRSARRRTRGTPAGPVVPERFAVLQALLAYLLAACGEGHDALIPAAGDRRAIPHPRRGARGALSLLNLVNFGGGCYTVYAELEGDTVHVDKELCGDTFRLAPRLTPLEARAIRLALEFVGPMIAADAHTPLDRVRMKLEETFGQFELTQTPKPQIGGPRRTSSRRSRAGMRERRLVEIEYQKEVERPGSTRARRAVLARARSCRTGTCTPGIVRVTRER